MPVPSERIRPANDAAVRPSGDFVLYWMTAFRRSRWNFSLDRALEWCRELDRPLVVLEALRVDYPWASDRHHRFVVEGMRDNAASFRTSPASYYPYLEHERGAGRGLLAALGERATVVVTDDSPSFFLPRMVAAAAARLPVLVEAVDSNGLWPMRATDRIFHRAYDFRRFLQRELPRHLDRWPAADPLARAKIASLGERVLRPLHKRWPPVSAAELRKIPGLVAGLPVDHSVTAGALEGGNVAAEARWSEFLEQRLADYATSSNDPDSGATSGLSPYLHFGHLSSHQMFADLTTAEAWSPLSLPSRGSGQRSGWWGMSASAEAFLDQLVTWRELGFNLASNSESHDRFESLPNWAQRTIDDHRDDPRPELYTREQLESASTQDEIWNAAQRQLVRDGVIHNYLRMLWGKKIFEWSETPEAALETMIVLNDKYALDGRDPNSTSGIFWCLGRYDRAWGPERPIFGKIRYMSSQNTRRKLKLKEYLLRYAGK